MNSIEDLVLNSKPESVGSTWPLVPLGNVVEINPRPAALTDDLPVSFIPMKCVEEESGRFLPLSDKKAAEVRKGYTAFRDGDVLFAKVTPCMENGKAAVMKGLTNGVGFGSTEFFVLRPTAKIDADYLLHFILQSSFRQQAAQNMTGAVGLRRVPKSYLEQQSIPLPSLPEQRRIVAEIEQQFTRLDAGVAALRRTQANLKRYRAAVLKAACEGRLVPTDTELVRENARVLGSIPTGDFDSPSRSARSKVRRSTPLGSTHFETGEALLARIVTERRQNWKGRGTYNEPAKIDVTKLGPIPDGWAWATVEHLADIGSGNTPPKITEHIQSVGPIPWFKVGDMNRPGNEQVMRSSESYLTPESADALGMKLFPAGSIIFPKRGGAIATNKKRLLEAPAATDLNVMSLTPHPDVSGYFKKWFASIDIASLSDGSNVPQVNNKDIQPLLVPLPPLNEQARIVAEVERRLSVVDELESVAKANLQRATRLRQSILQNAFKSQLHTGEE